MLSFFSHTVYDIQSGMIRIILYIVDKPLVELGLFVYLQTNYVHIYKKPLHIYKQTLCILKGLCTFTNELCVYLQEACAHLQNNCTFTNYAYSQK